MLRLAGSLTIVARASLLRRSPRQRICAGRPHDRVCRRVRRVERPSRGPGGDVRATLDPDPSAMGCGISPATLEGAPLGAAVSQFMLGVSSRRDR